MNWAEIGTQIIEYLLGIILSGVGVLLTYLINKYVKNNTVKEYLNTLNDLVKKCVQETYQTYVEQPKKEGTFDKEKQQDAFDICYQSIINNLPDYLKKWLDTNQKDIQSFLTTLIESAIYELKNNNKK